MNTNTQIKSVAVFRADGDERVGFGHLSRCAALARQLKRHGMEIVLVCRDASRPAGESLFPELTTVACVTETACEREDAAYVLDAFNDLSIKPDLILVDHYKLHHDWEGAIRKSTRVLAVIEDAARQHPEADAVLHISPAPAAVAAPPDGFILSGLRYALIAPSFQRDNNPTRSFTKGVPPRNILVSFGGTQPVNLLSAVLSVLEEVGEFHVAIVVGRDDPSLVELEPILRRHVDWEVHVDPDNIDELMAAADVAIGACGTMQLERMCIGLPSLVVTIAENQRDIARQLEEERCLEGLGTYPGLDWESVKQRLQAVLRNAELLKEFSENGRKLVDGRGAKRVASFLLAQQFQAEPIRFEDADALYEWRIHSNNMKYSRDGSEFTRTQHYDWMRRVLRDDRRVLLKIGLRDEWFGVVRYDVEGDVAAISNYMVPGYHGKGLGLAVMLTAEFYLRKHYPEIRRVRGDVHKDNTAKQVIDYDAGFIYVGEEDNWITFERKIKNSHVFE